MADIPPPAAVALVRRLYQEGKPLKAIREESGICNLEVLYGCLAGAYADGSGVAPAPIDRRRAGVKIRHRKGSRALLVARMWSTAERQVQEIEERLEAAGIDIAERESNARTLAVVARTLRDLTAVDQTQKPRGKETKNETDDDDGPGNVDDLRRELAEKLEKLIAGRSHPVSGDAET